MIFHSSSPHPRYPQQFYQPLQNPNPFFPYFHSTSPIIFPLSSPTRILARLAEKQNGNYSDCSIISMKQSFLQVLKNIQTVTVRDLQGQIRSESRNRHNSGTLAMHQHHASDLKIVSPFYDRINHKPDCKCKYHKRPPRVIPKLNKLKTQANEPILPNVRITQIKEESEDSSPQEDMKHLFEYWRLNMSSDDLKRYYFDYLKQLPNYSKFKRMDKLDCHNTAFQQFLKNNYLVILEKKEEKSKEKEVVPVQKSSQRLNKVYTEGNIDLQALSQCSYRKELLSYKDSISRTFQSENSYNPTSKEIIKIKKLGIRGTGKTLELIDEEEIRSRKEDNRRKKAKFLNSRPSFFGLIEDQQLLKELCMKLMNQNKRANKQAEVMVRHLVDSDVDMYQRMIGELQDDIQGGIKLRNLDEDQANVLIKIVLNKIQKQTQQIKLKDHNYEHKRSLIEDLCNKYGWPKEDKIVELKEFWKMRQEKQRSSNTQTQSRNSIFNSQSKGKISKNYINIDSKDSKEAKKSKSKVKIKDSRMSGFHGEKKIHERIQNSVKFMTEEKMDQEDTIKEKEEQYKFTPKRTTTKMGVFRSKEKKTVIVAAPEPQFRSSLHPRRAFVGGYRHQMQRDDDHHLNLQQMDDVVIQMQTMKQIQQAGNGQGQDSRNSSLYLSLHSHVQRHIQINKRFLKRIQHNLIDNQCERLVIGMGEGIITKKRKIRAIHAALKTEEIKRSEYYADILKYLEIYEDYCDLVIRTKRQRKARNDQDSRSASQHLSVEEQQREEEELDICMLLDSLSNERQLKYMDLALITEQEDPRQELILKIPQYTTNAPPKTKKLKKTIHGIVNQSESQPTQRVMKQQFGILQKNLQEKVTMQCRNNWNIDQEPMPSKASPTRPSVLFSTKLQNFRNNLLKRQEK